MSDETEKRRPDGHTLPGLRVEAGRRKGTPQSIMKESQLEHVDLPLKVLAGALPEDLAGHVFVAGPRMRSGTPALSSHGIVYRLDFADGVAKMTSAVMRPASWFLQRAVQSEGFKLRRGVKRHWHTFRSVRLGQMSLTIGAEELPNTAPVMIPSSGRLVITTDAGRPWMIDPTTLRAISPIGYLNEWRPAMRLPWMLPLLQTTAHAVVDPGNDDLYISNHAPKARVGPLVQPFTHVCRWRESDPRVRHWRMIDADTDDEVDVQTLHHVAVTRDFVVMLDSDFPTSLKESAAALLDPWFPGLAVKVEGDSLEKSSPVATVWIVRKSDLHDNAASLDPYHPPTVRAKRFTLGPGGLHIAVDYENPGGCIRVVMSHTPSEDLTHNLDEGELLMNGRRVEPWADGMLTPVPLIRGSVGVHDLDTATGNVSSRYYADDRYTWGIAVFTHAGPIHGELQGTRRLWFNAGGFTADLIPEDFYRTYRDRVGPRESLPLKNGIPASVFRFETTTGEFDGWNLPDGWYAFGPCFAPSTREGVAPDDGYLVAMALSDPTQRLPDGSSGDEIWIFDALDVKRGPICRLGSPDLDFGMTLHTLWLKDLPAPPATNRVNLRKDLDLKAIRERYERCEVGDGGAASRAAGLALRQVFKRIMDYDELERVLEEEVFPEF